MRNYPLMNPYNSFTVYDDFSYQRNGNLREFLDSTFIPQLLESVQTQCVLVLGGDGTMLRAIKTHSKRGIPFLWINFGHKGFLLNAPHWIAPGIPDFTVRKYPLLEVQKNEEKLGRAFNDIHLYSPEGKAISLQVDVWRGKLDLWGDGLILATPAGSTGHSKSYGGPILPHKSENLVITPKGNISPQSAKALDDSHQIRIRNTGRLFPVWINIDGEQRYVSQEEETFELQIRKSQKSVRLLIAEKHESDWDNKVLGEQGFSL